MSPRESYSDRMTCLLQGGEAIAQASGAARAFAEAQGLANEASARLCIVIEELVANLYDHGELTEHDQVELSVASETGCIRIIIADPGKPFDPQSVPPNYILPERGGGAGLNLVRSWVQFVDYVVTAEGNRLELMLPLPQ